MGGQRVGGGMDGKAVFRIAYSNQKAKADAKTQILVYMDLWHLPHKAFELANKFDKFIFTI